MVGLFLAGVVMLAVLLVVSLVLGDPTVRPGPPDRGVARTLRARTGPEAPRMGKR